MLLVVFLAYIVVEAGEKPTYSAWNPDYVDFPLPDVHPYPGWVYAICVLLAAVPCMLIPLGALFKLIQRLRKYIAHKRTPNPYDTESFTSDM
ncbi:hypothetical protein AALO_G00184550 [Alosa alosa]|uniref:Uncharacterized protein n=2 Tax=Alosa TaxID=34772 RepID=A0AAV6G9M4_9TELE|nr:hypothetical protein AALO_G00184550 [Alosa alosa]